MTDSEESDTGIQRDDLDELYYLMREISQKNESANVELRKTTEGAEMALTFDIPDSGGGGGE